MKIDARPSAPYAGADAASAPRVARSLDGVAATPPPPTTGVSDGIAPPTPLWTLPLVDGVATTADVNVNDDALSGAFYTSECRGGVERRQLKLKGVEVGD